MPSTDSLNIVEEKIKEPEDISIGNSQTRIQKERRVCVCVCVCTCTHVREGRNRVSKSGETISNSLIHYVIGIPEGESQKEILVPRAELIFEEIIDKNFPKLKMDTKEY